MAQSIYFENYSPSMPKTSPIKREFQICKTFENFSSLINVHPIIENWDVLLLYLW